MNKRFGQNLKKLRLKKGLTLRACCRAVEYDPSNWSKIERGLMSPPSDKKTLTKWAKVLKVEKDKIQKFIDEANLARGIIPEDILNKKNAFEFLPAFFGAVRNKKLTKEKIKKLIELIKKQLII